jgi:hypothetical protein
MGVVWTSTHPQPRLHEAATVSGPLQVRTLPSPHPTLLPHGLDLLACAQEVDDLKAVLALAASSNASAAAATAPGPSKEVAALEEANAALSTSNAALQSKADALQEVGVYCEGASGRTLLLLLLCVCGGGGCLLDDGPRVLCLLSCLLFVVCLRRRCGVQLQILQRADVDAVTCLMPA